MACKFNEFFTSIAKKTVANINPSPKSPVDLITQNLNSFKFGNCNLTKNEILNATKLLTNKKNSRSYRCLFKFCKTDHLNFG